MYLCLTYCVLLSFFLAVQIEIFIYAWLDQRVIKVMMSAQREGYCRGEIKEAMPSGGRCWMSGHEHGLLSARGAVGMGW